VCLVCVYAQAPSSKYFIGKQGWSCNQVCQNQGLNCNPSVQTGNNTDLFTQLGVKCTPDPQPWWAEDQPAYISGADPNQGKCLGYVNLPAGILCSGSYTASSRLCRCDAPSTDDSTLGTALAGIGIDTNERWIYQHVLAPGDFGVMTHFWTTAPPHVEGGVLIRYYIDGETNASIAFQPALACGVGFSDETAPWGLKWFGKGAADGGWFWNFRVPFQKSVVVTIQHLYGPFGGFYVIVRGLTNVPVRIGDLQLPSTARLHQFTTNATFAPLALITLASLPSGKGVFFMHTLSVQSGNPNFMEGCYHWILPGNTYPGILLASGTEDYFDSGWYFNAGPFKFPVSGLSHQTVANNNMTWSAYRFHEMDPLTFTNGFSFVWRNGDLLDAAGIKCMTLTGGTIVGSPTPAGIVAYAWAYSW